MTLAGRRIVLGVSGGISAYKAVDVCRRLIDAGAIVAPVLTRGALRFVGETTFSALASERVRTSLWDEAEPIPHTRLGQGADLVVVCPATARILSDYRTGRSADLLTATLIATRAPVVVCPAMHTEMWEHSAVQDNMAVLAARGVHIVGPESGRLAGGDFGAGRLAAPETVLAAIERVLGPRDLDGVAVLITAGGTRETIDPVRVITNRSSGKQGYALAEAAIARGARVTLVTTVDRAAPPGVAAVVAVESAADMQAAVMPRAAAHDVVIMAAAVADFRPKEVADHKLKKGDSVVGASLVPELILEPTHDFLVDLGHAKRADQIIVGFAAETDNVIDNARTKLARKNLDLIVANDVSAPNVGFAHETNEVTILPAHGEPLKVSLTSKRAIADRILDAIVRERSRQ
ncbi:MAG TPA: bifunctional phosphopantothenoylcysteine decarboxylase/phosphopantothenate--cysteine ligase CoaBC [Acidimicrobiales bacterium]|nr:bifunctional phosphopantothenoylcysteine decarboxylase/phosphopantothenate--cysteine ligase CoaBC [Acidimicrobiales bacterium]